jgi:hypothetical protein
MKLAMKQLRKAAKHLEGDSQGLYFGFVVIREAERVLERGEGENAAGDSRVISCEEANNHRHQRDVVSAEASQVEHRHRCSLLAASRN